jgi:hypothetical protein
MMKSFSDLPAEIRLSHFKFVVAASGADSDLTEEERSVLGFVSRKWGLSQTEVDQVYRNPAVIEFVISDSREVCFHQLYDLVEMAIIDSKLKQAERQMCLGYAAQLGFPEDAVDTVIQGILEGNQAGKSEEDIQAGLMARLA